MKTTTSHTLVLAIPFLATMGLGCAAQTDTDSETATEQTSAAELAASKSFEDQVHKRIPETRTGLVRAIKVGDDVFPKANVVDTIKIEVALSQNHGREIVLTLKSPGGTAYQLSPVGPKGIKKFKVDVFSGEKPNGQWKLEALDTNTNKKRAILKFWKLGIHSKAGGCFTDADCSAQERCEGARSCPEGAICILPSQPGTCVPDTCTNHTECNADEYCAEKKVNCPPGAHCILSVLPSTCEPIPDGRCLTHAQCKPEDDCFGTMNGTFLGDCIPKGAVCGGDEDCGSSETCDRHMHKTPRPGVYPILPQSGTCQPIPCQSDADCKAGGPGWSCKGMTDDHPVGQCEPQIYYILPPPRGLDGEKTTRNEVEDNDSWLRAVERRLG